jgi:hypothetical protein
MEREANHSTQSRAEINNAWSFTRTLFLSFNGVALSTGMALPSYLIEFPLFDLIHCFKL